MNDPNAEAPTIFVVDDDKLSRDSVCALAKSMGLNSVAFESAEDFLAAYSAETPGCLVTDVRMLGMSGLELLEELARRELAIPAVVVTAFGRIPLAVSAMQLGAVTMLEKPCDDQALWDAIREALRRDQASRAAERSKAEVRARFARLSPAERRVLRLVVDGKPNKVIAQALGVSIRTVETRRQRVYRKLKVTSLAALVKLCVWSGFEE